MRAGRHKDGRHAMVDWQRADNDNDGDKQNVRLMFLLSALFIWRLVPDTFLAPPLCMTKTLRHLMSFDKPALSAIQSLMINMVEYAL